MRPVSSAHRAASIATFLLLACGVAWGSQDGTVPRPVLIVVDDLHLHFRDSPRARRVLERLLPVAIRNGSTVAVVSTGPASIVVAPTRDAESLNTAVRRITGHALRPREVLDAGQQPQMLAELRRRTRVAEETAVSAIRVMSKIQIPPGLDVVYFSGGYVDEHAGEMLALVAAAVDANAAIHTIDFRDLDSGAPASYGITQDEWDRYLAVTRQSLRNLSVSTGGVMVVNDDHLAQVLARLGARQP